MRSIFPAECFSAMNESLDLSGLFLKAQNGDSEAANDIANFFLPKAIQEAKRKNRLSPNPMVDYDDFANSAMKSIIHRIQDGRLRFEGEKELGSMLKVIVARKAIKYWRLTYAEKRGEGQTLGENQLAHSPNNDGAFNFADLASYEKDSQFVNDDTVSLSTTDQQMADKVLDGLQVEIAGLFKTLLGQLDDKPRKVLLHLLSGDYSNKELSKKLNVAVVSIERYRAAIKRKLATLSGQGS